MQQSINKKVLDNISYLVGSAETIEGMSKVAAKEPFDESVVDFLSNVSKRLMRSSEAQVYPDIITLGFWMRKTSIIKLRDRFSCDDSNLHLGRGIVLHIAPSNVPVNYAYSLVSGLLTGNANIVRIPSKDFPQVEIINRAIKETLEEFVEMKAYICLVRYDRDQKVNDFLSAIADVRIIWGGDATIEEIRKSPLSSRAGEVTFADRYSLAVIDSDKYIEIENKAKVAEDFYNDTYLTDQNACTSPRIVVWTGSCITKAKDLFWIHLHEVVLKKYTFQPIQGINKITSAYLMAVHADKVKIKQNGDNLIVRVQITEIIDDLMDMKDNSGYFFEYDCHEILELYNLCNDKKCQTIGYIGDKDMFIPLIKSGIKGIDRIVPVGQTMDFDLIWDGYNLSERLTRTISIL
ncbi:MAG: hypothetical protein J6K48_00070 [Lachnospiraceae bacterium]|nr:hypothetical protein [Lachnospiraceae bacterium]